MTDLELGAGPAGSRLLPPLKDTETDSALRCHVKVDSKVDSKVTKPNLPCHLCNTWSATEINGLWCDEPLMDDGSACITTKYLASRAQKKRKIHP